MIFSRYLTQNEKTYSQYIKYPIPYSPLHSVFFSQYGLLEPDCTTYHMAV